MKELNILHLTNVMDVGGVQKIVFQLCKGTRDVLGHVVVASAGGEYEEQFKAINIKHFKIENISTRKVEEIHKLKYQLKQIIEEYNINLIHCHHRMAVLYAKLWFSNKIIIYNNHTIYTDKRLISHFLLSNIFIVADGIQAKKNLTDFFKIDNSKITIINNAVEEFDGSYSNISEIQREKENGKFIVMNCSRLHPQKGVTYFIDSAEILLKRELNISFFIVGDGELRSKLQQQVKEKGLDNHIFFLGFRKDIKNTIKNSDLLVQTSLCEGLPLTPMEAFSVGRTVVGTDIEGTREVIENGENGLLAESKDAKSIAEKIEQLYRDRGLLEKLNYQAHKTYLEKYSSDVMIKKYIEFYERLIRKD